ncbi:MAG: M81 family metallopeptidase [Planctomycetes bacterium]|nr:M81 family metallopeptidase [Planctomycetota bacterium]
MKRILIAECKQEVSTFNPNGSDYEDFGVRFGNELIEYHRTVRNEIGGALTVFDARNDIELVPTYSAFFITSGGTLKASAWERISQEFLESIRNAASQGPLDGVYFCMHGAMASDSEWDPEGYLLQESRKILGEEIPIVISLDLHGIPSDRMFAHSDAIVVYHTYPHVDFFQTGERAATLLLRIFSENVRPVTAKVAIPALVRGDELITETGLFGRCIAKSQRIEKSAKGLSAGMFIGNPFTDVPELRTTSFVVTDGEEDQAVASALEIAREFWEYHEQMQVPLVSLDSMVARMMERERTNRAGTVALVDAADATSSGASGDSNAILKSLLRAGYRGRTLLPIVDAPAVQAAFAAGIGATIRVLLGGTLDPIRFEPIEVVAKVRMLSDGTFRSESFGELWRSGLTAVLELGTYTIVAGSRGVNHYDRSYYYANGQNPKAFDAVIVKSPHCQHHMYAEWCDEMILVDAPGSSSANLKSLGHSRCPRPIFPLDADVPFAPRVQIFRRDRTNR